MPIYAYKCSSCGHAKDVLQKISDATLTVCPACSEATFAKQLTAPGFQLKGSGWYVTDFRDSKKAGAEAKSETEKSDTKADAKADNKTDSATEKKTEPTMAKPPTSPEATTAPAAAPPPAPATPAPVK